MTIFELSWGSDHHKEQRRYFRHWQSNDAIVRFAERVLEIDRDPKIGGGWVNLKRLPDDIYPDGHHLVAWTKTSNESPTTDGAFTTDEVES